MDIWIQLLDGEERVYANTSNFEWDTEGFGFDWDGWHLYFTSTNVQMIATKEPEPEGTNLRVV